MCQCGCQISITGHNRRGGRPADILSGGGEVISSPQAGGKVVGGAMGASHTPQGSTQSHAAGCGRRAVGSEVTHLPISTQSRDVGLRVQYR